MLLSFAVKLFVAGVLVKATFSRPNVVILLADNLGYADIGVFGAPTAKTPHIDSLGAHGIKLNNWNSAAHLCSASRAALLTGKYPVRSGVYPGVFKPDAEFGLLPAESTLAEYLKEEGYATSAVGKWHLGHRPEFSPTNQGFDEWLGVPYHMSGGSLEGHTCIFDTDGTMWLPLYQGLQIVEQPVKVENLAQQYIQYSRDFIWRQADAGTPFFLYMAFSHVHQLCAPRDSPEQKTCQWSANGINSSFVDAVEEMDIITGGILLALEETGTANDTLVLFTSDNGPWVAEQACSGFKGPFEGRWLQDNSPLNCTACPHDYVPNNTATSPRQCTLPGTENSLDGVQCGHDTGLGSLWEANLRMPALARWPSKIAPGTETMALLSSLDVVPTVLSVVSPERYVVDIDELDGIDVSQVLFGREAEANLSDRVLFFWRDGFAEGPLPTPYGRIDVAAVKVGNIKAWLWTKSAHYNDDIEVEHNPPLLFDTLNDPAEAYPLSPNNYADLIEHIYNITTYHKNSIDWGYPLTLSRDPRFIPCVDRETGCRTQIGYVDDNSATAR